MYRLHVCTKIVDRRLPRISQYNTENATAAVLAAGKKSWRHRSGVHPQGTFRIAPTPGVQQGEETARSS